MIEITPEQVAQALNRVESTDKDWGQAIGSKYYKTFFSS